MKHKARPVHHVVIALVMALLLITAVVSVHAAPTVMPTLHARQFCVQFMDELGTLVALSPVAGVTREAWHVSNGPQYLNAALNAYVLAIYDGKPEASTTLYAAAVSACVKYKTTTNL